MAERVDIEARLRDLAPHLAFPATPLLAAAVGRRLRQAPPRHARLARLRDALRGLARPSAARRVAFAVAAVVAIALAALTIRPVREGIARFLKLQGVTNERREQLATPSPPASGRSIGDRLIPPLVPTWLAGSNLGSAWDRSGTGSSNRRTSR